MTKFELDRHVGIAQQILRALNCPRALTVFIMLEHGMWDEIANLRSDPSHFNDSWDFYRYHQATKLLSKAKWLATTIDTQAVAKAKFLEAEEQCRRTNLIWGQYRRGKLNFIRDYERIFHAARRKIGMVLGDNLYGWTEFCDFGPGADGSTENGMTSAYNKLLTPGSITLGACPYLEVFASITRLGHCFVGNIETRSLVIEIARGNKVTFVPKNAKTDRPIAVEPRWNMWMQKGFGLFLRKRLKYFGVNLDFQGLNQALAILSSHSNSYATIDLASASDTVSKDLVMALLPEPWLDILAALRSPSYLLDGEWGRYEKWSSMGNGYTFELESLLFWALGSSIDEDIAVYGDDLIVPTKSFRAIVNVLETCGFSINTEKSFADGYFRESCGQDAFNGDSVTPIYWKELLDDQGTLTLVNQVSLLSQRLTRSEYRTQALRPVWKELVYQLPKRLQQRGPSTLSTVVHDCCTAWNAVRRYGWDGVWLNVLQPVPRKYRFWDYNAAILSQTFQPSSDGYSVRDRVAWKKKTVFVPCGYVDIGPWV